MCGDFSDYDVYSLLWGACCVLGQCLSANELRCRVILVNGRKDSGYPSPAPLLPWLHILSVFLSSAVLPTDNKDVSVMMSEMDVNAIAGTLKLYFRELPEPLFTDDLYPNFAGGIG